MKNQYLLVFVRALPYLLIVAYIAGLLWSIAIGRYNFAISGSILVLPAIAAAIVLLTLRQEQDPFRSSVHLFPLAQKRWFFYLGLLYPTIILSLLCCRINIFPRQYRRSILLSFCRSFPGSPTSCYIDRIMLTMACLIYETTLKYPVLILGGLIFSPHIYVDGNIPFGAYHPQTDTGYAYFPLYHIWIALSSHVIAIDIKTTLFLITCPVCDGSSFPVLFKRVTGNVQVALLACLLY